MIRVNALGLSVAAALFTVMSPIQAAWISGQLSGTGQAGVVISQNNTDFLDPVGPPNGMINVGANASNATGSFAGLNGLGGLILDFMVSGNSIGLANFMTVGSFTFTLDSVAPGTNYGGQNTWLFQDITGGVAATMVANGRVFNTNSQEDEGVFQATFSTQFQRTTSAQLLDTLNRGGALNLQSYSFTVDSPVPEPGSWAMMLGGLGLVGAGISRRRRQ